MNYSPPIQRIQFSEFKNSEVEIFMKRDDLLHPFISGNKWRKLKYILLEAKAQSKNHLVSFGGPYSNHLLALACAGATYGFKTTGFVRGERVSNKMLQLCEIWGMQLSFISREEFKDKPGIYQKHFGAYESSYFIDEGGKGELAIKGCEEILDEVNGFTHVICAVGTGTTLAGLTRASYPKQIMAEGICVLKGAEKMDAEIAAMARLPVKVHHRFHGGGYAKADPTLLPLIKKFASETGILLDSVYNAKMLSGVLTLVKEGYYSKDNRLLLLHTGGLLGLLSYLNSGDGEEE